MTDQTPKKARVHGKPRIRLQKENAEEDPPLPPDARQVVRRNESQEREGKKRGTVFSDWASI